MLNNGKFSFLKKSHLKWSLYVFPMRGAVSLFWGGGLCREKGVITSLAETVSNKVFFLGLLGI